MLYARFELNVNPQQFVADRKALNIVINTLFPRQRHELLLYSCEELMMIINKSLNDKLDCPIPSPATLLLGQG